MNRWPLSFRFFILSFFTSVIVGVGSFIGIQSLVKDQFLALKIQSIIQPVYSSPKEITREQLLGKGLSPDVVDLYLQDGKITSKGFVYSESLGTKKFIYTYKHGKKLYSLESSGGFVDYLKDAGIQFGILIFGLCILTSVFMYIVSLFFLRPVRFLRKITEDIIVGKYEVDTKYKANDDLGSIFKALGRLCKDLEEKERELEKTSELATKDGLTGLKNHRAFKEELTKVLSLSSRHGRSFGLILMDVDHFKKFNDTYGHQQGDEVLRFVGKTLMKSIRSSDFVARYGGEEFVVILPETEKKGIYEAAEKLRKAVEEGRVNDINNPGQTLSVTASFGGYCVEGSKIDMNEDYKVFVEECDKNLYEAKKLGRNCSFVTSEEDKKAA